MKAVSDTAPAVTGTLAALTPTPPGATSLGVFSHPSCPEIAGRLVHFPASNSYAILSGRTLTTVPASWATRQARALCEEETPA